MTPGSYTRHMIIQAARLVLINLLLVPTVLWAQTAQPNIPVDAPFAIGSGQTPSIDRNKSGDFVVAWIQRDNQTGNPSGTHIMARRFLADGTPQGSAFRVSPPGPKFTKQPQVGMADDGTFVVGWVAIPVDSPPSRQTTQSVFIQRYDANSNPLGDLVVAGKHVEDAALDVDASGRIIVAWSRYVTRLPVPTRQGPPVSLYQRETFFFRRYGSQGNPLGPRRFVVDTFNTINGYNSDGPSLGVRGDGAFVIAYTRQHVRSSTVFAKRYNANGIGQQILQKRLAPSDQSNFAQQPFHPAIGVDRASGNIVATWLAYFDGGFFFEHYLIPQARIFSKRLRAEGDAFDAIEPRISDSRRYLFVGRSQPALVLMQPGGQFTLAVEAARRNIDTGEYLENGKYNLLFQTYSTDGTPIGAIQTVNDNPDSRDEPGAPDAAVDGDGDIAFAYSIGAGDQASIYVRLYKTQP